MLVYQRTPSRFRFNQAHNHYLQVAAEGGLLLGHSGRRSRSRSFARAQRRAWSRDDSGMYWIRAGRAVRPRRRGRPERAGKPG